MDYYLLHPEFFIRLCHQENPPIIGPLSHPFPPLLPLRLCLATSSEEEKQKLSDVLIQACWGLGKDKKTLEEILIENDFGSEALMIYTTIFIFWHMKNIIKK